LQETPWDVVQAHLAMMPGLRAEESLLAVTRTALGSGCVEKREARELLREWERTIYRAKRRRHPGSSTDPVKLASSGVGVIIERRPRNG
jgi:hypothetical protein